ARLPPPRRDDVELVAIVRALGVVPLRGIEADLQVAVDEHLGRAPAGRQRQGEGGGERQRRPASVHQVPPPRPRAARDADLNIRCAVVMSRAPSRILCGGRLSPRCPRGPVVPWALGGSYLTGFPFRPTLGLHRTAPLGEAAP